jgi:hypothetical protein
MDADLTGVIAQIAISGESQQIGYKPAKWTHRRLLFSDSPRAGRLHFPESQVKCCFSVVNMDFMEAREKRREILGILKEQQSEDAACLDQIKAVAIEGKRALLHALAEWLASVRPDQPITTSIRNAFSTLGTGLTAEDWQNTQVNYDEAEARLKQAVAEEAKAEAEYRKVAPWGIASTLFADDSRKRQIEPI